MQNQHGTRAQLIAELTELRRRVAELEAAEIGRRRMEEYATRLNDLKEQLFGPSSLDEKLKIITDGIIQIFDADFARIWISREADLCERGCPHAAVIEEPGICHDRTRCLHLVASSGRYTRLDGSHRRVPLGSYKIGRVASGEDPRFITNDVSNDPRVHDHEWAKSLGLVSFAGYRLISAEGKPIGVLALFSRRAIAPDEEKLLEDLAHTTSQVILTEAAEDALRESEWRYRLLAENATDVIWTADMDMRLTYISPSVTRLLGYSVEEAMSQTTQEVFAPASFERARLALQEELALDRAGAGAFNRARLLELELKRKDGSTVPVEVNYSFLRDAAKCPVEILAIARDITERKRTEEALHRRAGELAALNATVLDIVAPHDLPTLLHTIVERAAHLLNAPSGGLYLCEAGRQVRCVVSYHTPRDYTGVMLQYGEGVAGTVAQTGQPLIISDYRTWSGRAAVFEQDKPFSAVLSVPIVWQGQVTGVIHVLDSAEFRQFTPSDLDLLSLFASHAAIAVENARLYEAVRLELADRKQAEAALEAERALLEQHVKERTQALSTVNAELVKANRSKDEFLAAMRHELRTPLNAILGMSGALLEQAYGPLNEKQLKSVRTIEESGQRLRELINNILDLSLIMAGKVELQIEPVYVEEICHMSLKSIQQAAKEKRLGVSLKVDDRVTTIQADGRRLRQVLVNLLSNAVKFTPEGGAIGLEVVKDAEKPMVHLTVWDTGIGITPEDRGQLFQPFVQLDSKLSRQYGGTGLGLTLVEWLVRMHGGQVTMASDGVPGRGSRFTVSLPFAAL